MVGSTISHYEILEEIGHGGMGVVYKACDTRLGRNVALKILPPDRVADTDRRLRFVQEARAASALNHPNIISVHDIDSAGDVHFIAMEYVDGQTLDRLIGKRGLAPKEAVGYGVQIADALAKAHSAGIIHRDIKPSNIMVTPDGLVKILDFGLAKLVERTRESGDEATRTMGPVTEVGQVVGTMAYMSPEQATGGRFDARTDIFSFGAVLYEMLTGRRPFAGDTGASTLEAILAKDPTPPSSVVAGLPFELERAVLRCLRKDAQRRWQTMADLKVALQDLKEELDSGQVSQVVNVTAVARRPRSRRVVVWAAALAVVAAATAAGWWFLRPAAQPAAGFELERLTFEGSAVLPPAISHDGKLIAYAAERNGRYSLNVRQMRAREAIRLPQHEGNDWFPCFSPDGLKIVYRSERDGGGLYMIDTLGGASGAELKIADGGHYPSFSPDGTTIAYIIPNVMEYSGQMFLVSAGGGLPRPFQPGFVVVPSEGVYQPPLWSPDGASILFKGARTNGPANVGWWVAAAAGGEPVAVGDVPREEAWLPRFLVAWRAGYLYYVEGDPINGSTMYRLPLSPGPWRVTGRPEKVASPAGLQLGGSTSSGGRMVFASIVPATNVWSAPLVEGIAASARLERVTTDSLFKRHLTAAGNGSKVAYVTFSQPVQGNVEVRIRDMATGRESLIAGSGKWPLLDPTLSFDGSQVLYADRPDRKLVTYLADTASSSGRVLCEGCMARGFFSNPAAALVEASDRLVKQPIDGGAGVAVMDAGARGDVALSPDGSRLAFTHARPDGPGVLYVADITHGPADSGALKLVAEDRNYIGTPAWSTDAKYLYYVSQRDGFPCIWRRPIAADGEPAGSAVAVLHLHPGSGMFTAYNNIAIAGDRLYVLATEVRGDVYSVTLDR